MRNRCVEIHLASENFNKNIFSGHSKSQEATSQGLNWEDARLINKSKCNNTAELILSERIHESSGISLKACEATYSPPFLYF